MHILLKLKEITCFEDCLIYVHFLGAISHSKDYSVDYYQTDLCVLCDRINVAAGNATWLQTEFKPFFIKYTRKERKFTIIAGDNIKVISSKE
jgi:hypothetical protein